MKHSSPSLPQGTPEQRQTLFGFLRGIGIPVEEAPRVDDGFLEGVRVQAGALMVGPAASLDSILHDAGHLATTPLPFRSWMSGNLAHGQRRMFQTLARIDLDPDGALVRAAVQMSDPEASAWAWAAGLHLGLPGNLIILDDSYDGEGPYIRSMLEAGCYLGINGLAHGGLCARGALAAHRGLAPYPAMQRWTQDGPFPEWEQAVANGALGKDPAVEAAGTEVVPRLHPKRRRPG